MSTLTVYEGTARHRRVSPAREFSPKLFLAYLDVDELPGSLDDIPGWSGRRRAPVHFRRRDFFDGRDRPLGAAVRDLVEARLGRRPVGRVHLLAQLRTFGWLFNPIAVYYCWERDGRTLDALVLEVSNTPWGERHWYVLDARHANGTETTAKAMHVSPFLPMDLDYRISWTPPGHDLHLTIDVVRGGTPLFSAALAMRRAVLSPLDAVTILVRYPLAPLRVSLGIYRRALTLLATRVPVHRHPRRQPQEVNS